MIARFLLSLSLAVASGACAAFGGGSIGPDERAEQRAAIEAVLADQVEAWNRGDLEEFMEGYWRSPGLVFTSGGRIQRGWDSTLARYRAAYGERPDRMGRLSFSSLEVHPLGRDTAWVMGRWTLTANGAARGGVFTLVFQRLGGGWVIVHDHTSEAEEG